jgi:hypothetical protein
LKGKPVTHPSLILCKPTRIAGQYFLYCKYAQSDYLRKGLKFNGGADWRNHRKPVSSLEFRDKTSQKDLTFSDLSFITSIYLSLPLGILKPRYNIDPGNEFAIRELNKILHFRSAPETTTYHQYLPTWKFKSLKL